MSEKEALVGNVEGRIIFFENLVEDPISESLHDSLKKYFTQHKLAPSVMFPFLNGQLLLSVHQSQYPGYRWVTFTLVTKERIELSHRFPIQEHLKKELNARGVSISFIGSVPGGKADVTDYDRFEIEDVEADCESLVSGVEISGEKGLRIGDAFSASLTTNHVVLDCLISSLLRQKRVKYDDGRLFLA